jgi:hypothetical protein
LSIDFVVVVETNKIGLKLREIKNSQKIRLIDKTENFKLKNSSKPQFSKLKFYEKLGSL